MTIQRWAIIFSGRVQGVYFRKFTAQQADINGLSGFVRNMPDGSVYAEVQGPLAMLEKFKSACTVGPPLAKVQSVEDTEIPLREEVGFHIQSGR